MYNDYNNYSNQIENCQKSLGDQQDLFQKAVSNNEYSDMQIPDNSALIVVDVQNDFISGSLSLFNTPSGHDGNEIVPGINQLIQNNLEKFKAIAFTRDWHPAKHISFFENRELYQAPENSTLFQKVDLKRSVDDQPYSQILWPAHCIQNTDGAEYHPDLLNPQKLAASDSVTKSENAATIFEILKGVHTESEAYSGFFDNNRENKTELDDKLKNLGIQHVFIVGIATDVCVDFTVRDAVDLGYQTHLILDLCRGVDTTVIDQEVIPRWKELGVDII